MADPILEKSHYETLGILPIASEREIKHKYRKLALAHHPDKGGDETVFKQIKHAAECLLDPKSRIEYDRVLKEARADMFVDEPPPAHDETRGEEPQDDTGNTKKTPRTSPSDWWFHAMYSEIEEIYRETLRKQAEWGTRPAKLKPFSGDGKKTSRTTTKNRFRRPSMERLWMDKGLN
jgi:curved DNA-binding protein CbpA